mmetsp:Transcript_17704/g.44910  ORF Transcript_17704/g.44910 Transcript_17704/m.44910 type:complete len:498 (-) Transcript_17704:510-2003(-)
MVIRTSDLEIQGNALNEWKRIEWEAMPFQAKRSRARVSREKKKRRRRRRRRKEVKKKKETCDASYRQIYIDLWRSLVPSDLLRGGGGGRRSSALAGGLVNDDLGLLGVLGGASGVGVLVLGGELARGTIVLLLAEAEDGGHNDGDDGQDGDDDAGDHAAVRVIVIVAIVALVVIVAGGGSLGGLVVEGGLKRLSALAVVAELEGGRVAKSENEREKLAVAVDDVKVTDLVAAEGDLEVVLADKEDILGVTARGLHAAFGLDVVGDEAGVLAAKLDGLELLRGAIHEGGDDGEAADHVAIRGHAHADEAVLLQDAAAELDHEVHGAALARSVEDLAVLEDLLGELLVEGDGGGLGGRRGGGGALGGVDHGGGRGGLGGGGVVVVGAAHGRGDAGHGGGRGGWGGGALALTQGGREGGRGGRGGRDRGGRRALSGLNIAAEVEGGDGAGLVGEGVVLVVGLGERGGDDVDGGQAGILLVDGDRESGDVAGERELGLRGW